MLFPNPSGNGALINFELFSCGLLGAEEGNEVLVKTVHAAPPYGNTHIPDYRKTDLQGYGSARNTQRMEFKDRLKAARQHAKLNQAELAVRAGITQTSISDLERGKSKATAHVAKIADVCGVNALWLSDGKGDMTAFITSNEPSNVSMAEQPSRMYRYPLVSWVAAGEWSEAVEPYPPGAADEYDVSDYKAKGPAFWLVVKGDSMTAPTAPSIPEGSQILIDTRAEVLPGKLVIAKLADSNEATFKKLVEDGGVRYLKPLNSAYPTVQCTEDCRIIGVVVRSLTKFA